MNAWAFLNYWEVFTRPPWLLLPSLRLRIDRHAHIQRETDRQACRSIYVFICVDVRVVMSWWHVPWKPRHESMSSESMIDWLIVSYYIILRLEDNGWFLAFSSRRPTQCNAIECVVIYSYDFGRYHNYKSVIVTVMVISEFLEHHSKAKSTREGTSLFTYSEIKILLDFHA